MRRVGLGESDCSYSRICANLTLLLALLISSFKLLPKVLIKHVSFQKYPGSKMMSTSPYLFYLGGMDTLFILDIHP